MIAKDTLLQNAVQVLKEAEIEDARWEARLLLCWATGLDAAGLWQIDQINDVQADRFEKALERRATREPMAFITGETGFWTLDLETAPDTLIPRGDSESLIEVLLAVRPDQKVPLSILDLGTGTGCLLLAALSEYPNAWGVGVDLAPQAVDLARRNARRTGLAERCMFLAGHWGDALCGRFDVVLSNPPYIESADIAGLMPEVSRYEPVRALDGGNDGLEAYRLICKAMPTLLVSGGHVILEMGIGQMEAVSALGRCNGLHEVARRADLGGVERALVMRWTGSQGKTLA
ncbi:peptide chain release factor N(5)-glutamine methyltransferase [Gluconobacter morbifer]|uniref:Release factor glutamine methyltransferase n=1 Tax=Gluconobacter morbifer G707 TaxID=1088869 RepID=G6XI76_9PROT|nr:peptide chain release factor N(5)-glutamine methyltransferase [Gluconobacter morbifer]EHH68516.1 HemK family protein [Gluconobacter morbifer G707]